MVCLLVCLALWLWCVTHKNYTAGFLLSSLLLPLAVPPLLQLLRCARSGTGLVGESCSALLLLMLLGGILAFPIYAFGLCSCGFLVYPS
jgi:hypothetical protein